MRLNRYALAAATLAATAAALAFCVQDDRAAELERVKRIAEELLPVVAEVTGLPAGDPVNIVITDKAEVQQYILRLLEEEYPGDELQIQSRCLAKLGLLPDGYDMRAGYVELLTEQAGAFYDPRTDTYYSIIDLPEQFKIPIVERTFAAHELTHALQDRAIDLEHTVQAIKDDSDLAYARSSVMEGMAVVAMIAATQSEQAAMLFDLGQMMRAQLQVAASDPTMQVFASSPRYMQESLLSPYAEGASFVQAWLKAEEGRKAGALLNHLPTSSEQIMHFDKYVDTDDPTRFDLAGLNATVPTAWEEVYENTLGEFDIWVLAQLFASTSEHAQQIAAGWDGLGYKAFTSGDDLLLTGVSIWDSDIDAAEFAEGFGFIQQELNGSDGAAVRRAGPRVAFVIGELGEDEREEILQALISAPERTTGAN